MARTFVIKTKYTANGSDVLKTQSKMSKGFGRFAGQMADQNSMIGKSFTRMNQGINNIAKIGLIALAGSLALATAEYIKFDQTIVGANTRFTDFVQGSEQSVKTLENLKVAAREVGKTTQFSGVEAAKGLNFYAKAGFTSAEAMAVLADTVDLATVAEADFNRTADISSDLLGALGLNVENSAKKIQNLKDVNRALGITANSANVDLEDLFETLKVAAPIATKAGESMNTLFAMTGALGGAGIKGSMGATALKNAYINLAKNAPNVQKALEGIGLAQKDFIDQETGALNMVKAMQLMGDATKDFGNAEQLKVFGEIFGKNAVAGALNLADSLSEVELIMKKLESATALKDLADEIRKGLGMQIEILKSGLIELGFKFVEAFEKDGRGALQSLIDFVQKVDIQPLINFATIIGKIFKVIAKNWKIMLSLAGGIKAVAVAMGILNIATTVFGVALKANPIGMIITAVFALGAAVVWMVLNWDKVTATLKTAWTWIANVGQKFLFLLGPIGFLVSGIIEIVKSLGKIKDAFSTEGFVAGMTVIAEAFNRGLIIPVQKAWDLLKQFGSFLAEILIPVFISIGEWIAKTGQKFTFLLGPIGFLVSALIEIAKQWDTIKESFASGGILGGILAIGRALLSGLLAPMQGFLEMISNIPGIGNLTAGLSEKLSTIRAGLETPGGPNPSPNAFDPNQGYSLGRPETPTPTTPVGEFLKSSLDINIRNSAGDNAEIKQKGNMPTGTKMNFVPAVSL